MRAVRLEVDVRARRTMLGSQGFNDIRRELGS